MRRPGERRTERAGPEGQTFHGHGEQNARQARDERGRFQTPKPPSFQTSTLVLHRSARCASLPIPIPCVSVFSRQARQAESDQYCSGKFFREDDLAWKPCGLHRSRWSRRPWDFHAIAPLKGRSRLGAKRRAAVAVSGKAAERPMEPGRFAPTIASLRFLCFLLHILHCFIMITKSTCLLAVRCCIMGGVFGGTFSPTTRQPGETPWNSKAARPRRT